MNDVRVVDAPGYADFDGVLLMEVSSVDNRPMSVVGFEWEGVRDFELFPSEFVHPIEK